MLTKGVLIACLDQIGLVKLWEDLIQVNPINEALCRVNFRCKGWSYSGADLGGGCRGCAPPLEMTCGFLIQLVFCKK